MWGLGTEDVWVEKSLQEEVRMKTVSSEVGDRSEGEGPWWGVTE